MWREEFNNKFPNKIAEVIDDFGDTTKSDIKDFMEQQFSKMIDDIPDKQPQYIKGRLDPIADIDFSELKQQLRDKWLSNSSEEEK